MAGDEDVLFIVGRSERSGSEKSEESLLAILMAALGRIWRGTLWYAAEVEQRKIPRVSSDKC